MYVRVHSVTVNTHFGPRNDVYFPQALAIDSNGAGIFIIIMYTYSSISGPRRNHQTVQSERELLKVWKIIKIIHYIVIAEWSCSGVHIFTGKLEPPRC